MVLSETVKRRTTISVRAGTVTIGSSAPIRIQSMTKVPTADVARCVRQVRQLADAGCDLVRVAVPRRVDTLALARIIQKVSVPIIADVHFSPERAIEAIEAGCAKIRLNPGNIRNPKDVARIIDAAKMHKTAVRIGINEASIDKPDHRVPAQKRVRLMLEEMRDYVRIFERRSFTNLVLSAKSSDTLRTIEINRRIAEAFNYPIHIGLTHAGLPEDARIPSAVALGTLLAEGIGDTIRVSAAGNPVLEVEIAKQILLSLALSERSGPELIVCPTCGRAEIDVIKLARRVKKAVSQIARPLRVAVMGCIVNGPGEAADADVAVCAAKDKAFIYRRGRRVAIVSEDGAIARLVKEIENL